MAIKTKDRDKLAIAAAQKTKEQDYWLEKLKGEPSATKFPYTLKPSGEKEELRKQDTLSLEGELFARINKVSGGTPIRLHMIAVAAVSYLLSRYSGKDDIYVGTPVFVESKKLKCELLNTVVPLRTRINGTDSFKQLLTRVKETVTGAATNQAYPIEILVEKLGLEIETDAFPLFDVGIVIDNIQNKSYMSATSPKIIYIFNKTAAAVEITIDYSTLHYDSEYIRQIARHLKRVLSNLLNKVDQPISEIEILSDEERKGILYKFNDTKAKYPLEKTIVQIFEEQVEKGPERIAIVSPKPGEGTAIPTTYGELNENANRMAHLLKARGVGRETVVGILMERSPQIVTAVLAVLKAGGAYLPIDPDYPENRIRSILEESAAAYLLTGEKLTSALTFTALKNLTADNQEPPLQPVVTAPRQQTVDFNTLPTPNRTLVDYSKYHKHIGIAPVKQSITLQTSRGCPYNCIYCHKIWPKRHIMRSAENIYEEIRWAYEAGVRDYVFIDDIFNLNKENSGRLLKKIITDKLNIRLYFPNGLRADILDKEFIDLMMAAGTVNIDVALESSSPRLQKLLRKNLNVEKFAENIRYIAEKYPYVLLEMELMHGFPTETEEEALQTFEFLKTIKWIHFPNLNILKIFPNTDMYGLAIENGVSKKAIEDSTNFAFHELPETLPFPKKFTRQYQARFLDEYFLLKERMLHVLPQQVKHFSEAALVGKYDSYLPADIRTFDDILEIAGITREEIGDITLKKDADLQELKFNEKMAKHYPVQEKSPDAFRLLLLDISQFFTNESGNMLYDVTEEPLGLMYLLTHLDEQLGAGIQGKIYKSRMDFNDYNELKNLVDEFKPDLIGLRSLSYFGEFFHRTVSVIDGWGKEIPIVAGGPYATSDYHTILRDTPVELVVLGEGEHTFLELLQRMIKNENKIPNEDQLKEINGIAYIPARAKPALKKQQREIVLVDTVTQQLENQPAANPRRVNEPGDLLYLIATSGSTGKPKSVMMEHHSLANLIHYQWEQTTIAFDKVMQFASIAFDVSFQEIFTTLLAGGSIHLLNNEIRSNIPLLLDYIEEHQIETLFLPPAFLRFIFDEEEYGKRFPSIVKHIVTAGEQLVVTEPMRNYLEANKVHLHNHYGPAETHVVTTFTMGGQTTGDSGQTGSGGDQTTGGSGQTYPHLPVIGKPISNTRIVIADEQGRIQPVGVAGEIYIIGEAVGRGYRGQEELTAQRYLKDRFGFEGRVFRTGDMAHWQADGNIRFLGRKDFQVQIRGFRIELEEIETQLQAIHYIKEAVVIDRKNEAGEPYLCAYVIMKNKPADQEEAEQLLFEMEFDPGDLRDRLMANLPDYMVPSAFVRLNEIPLNDSGKIDRKQLPEPQIGESQEGYTAPRTPTEKKLLVTWEDVLEKQGKNVGIDDNFFETGGHSLKGTVLISKIHKAFGIKIMLVDLFKYPTIRQLSKYLKEAGTAGTVEAFSTIEPAPIKDNYPLSPAQKRLYTLQQMAPSITTYNIPMVTMLEGEVEKEKVQQAFKTLIQRHESLRTALIIQDRQTVQKIYTPEEIEFACEYMDVAEEAEVKPKIEQFIRPFDLTRAPLLRVALVKIADGQRHLLMVDMHHVVSDGVTINIIVSEFTALYAGKTLPPNRLQYKDYSEWQKTLVETGAMAEQEKFWKEKFKGELPELNMPLDYPRPEVKGAEGASQGIAAEEDLTLKVRERLNEAGVTLYQYTLAVYKLVLHKYSGQTEIIVGSPVSGRRHMDLEGIVGVFINMVAIRTQPEPTQTFNEYLHQVKANALAAYENQDYQFDRLVSTLGLQGTPGRNPVFDVGLLYNAPIPERTEDIGFKITPYEIPHSSSRFDMLMAVSEEDNRLTLNIEYSTQLFKQGSIKKFLEHYIEIVKKVTTDPEIKLDDITIAANLKKIEAQKPEISFGF
ncbi:MAG: AMP-binding protein [bacterium]|nr:AMP-binding protein [bacterium]